jgi:membrane-associated phospholipid phosphatase
MRAGPATTLGQRLKVFCWWGGWVGLAFFSIYPTTNWLAELNTHHYSVHIAAELRIPFVAGFIWFYLSMYLLFSLPPFFLDPPELKRLGIELLVATAVAGLVFVAFPVKLGFERVAPDLPLYRDIYAAVFSIDKPFNLVPSLHVVYSSAITLSIVRKLGDYSRGIVLLWATLIAASTVLVHQHHLLDVVTALVLVVCVSILVGRKHV